MINCIDCDHTISEHARMCPSCGRPWPADGVSPSKKFVKKVISFLTFDTIWYIFCVIGTGAMVGAGIQLYLNKNPDFSDISDYFWEDFLYSSAIGTPVVILLGAITILAGLLWFWVVDKYLIVEHQITKTKKHQGHEHIVKRYSVEARRRTILRWVLVSPILLLVINFLN